MFKKFLYSFKFNFLPFLSKCHESIIFCNFSLVSNSFLFLLVLIFSSKIAYGGDSVNYSGPGDNKEGYELKSYTTNSLSIDDRKGKKADLIQYVTIKQLGLPKLIIPEDNPITRKKIELGKSVAETSTSFILLNVSFTNVRNVVAMYHPN